MKHLFLDDERNPSDVFWMALPQGPWDIVRTQPEFESYILVHGIPDHISFDNDLGTGCGEGVFCANWLIEAVLDNQVEWNPNFQFTVHSKNAQAASRIVSKLQQFSGMMNSG